MTLLPQPVTPAAMSVAMVLAQQPGSDTKPGEEEFGKSSPVGLVVLLLFLVAVVLLVRSMTKHLKRVPDSFEPDAETTSEAAGDEPAEPGQPKPGRDDEPADTGDR